MNRTGAITGSSLLAVLAVLAAGTAQGDITAVAPDPVTRWVHISYQVPADAPDVIEAHCSWAPAGQQQWQPARVLPLLSETGVLLLREDDWRAGVERGRVVERRAAGLERTVVFQPYPEAQTGGFVDADFRIELRAPDGTVLSEARARVQADNTDVVCVEDWSKVMQADALTGESGWSVRTEAPGATLGNDLSGAAAPGQPLRQLTYPLDVRGWYAIFACTSPAQGGIRLRLTGDERTDALSSRHAREEVFWRWARMDRQHLVLKPPYTYTGNAPAHIDYVKLVPLSDTQAQALDARYGGETDKLIAGYWEPYSWAFYDDVQETLQHREPLSAFAEARIAIVDTQLGRFGMKSVFETRKTDQLIYATIGDPVEGDPRPHTDNVGRMQQYTNTLDATLRYTREFGLRAHANFGASNCYPGSPLQGGFSETHPEWMRGSALRFEVPEVRDYALSLYREALEIGAAGLSLDFCRYPETIDTVETCNTFLRDLRALADEFGAPRNAHIPILVRFPGTGVRRAELFDYPAWAREGWVDYLCPSNIQGRHHHIDMAPYFGAVQGTSCTLLPCIDGLSWGVDVPGPFLWRAARLYEQGAQGLYIYQADGRILGRPEDRRCLRMLSSSSAINAFWDVDARLRPRCSKGIHLSRPSDPGPAYHGWERIRIWVEGVPLGPLEAYVDGQLVTQVDGPPYLAGTEEYASDGVIPPGEHTLRVRVRDGDGWLEQTFAVQGAD